jgi:DNA-binding PadR family transcriptional regulator
MKYLTRQEEMILLAVWQLRDNAYLVTIRHLLSRITGKKWSMGAAYVPLNRLFQKGYLQDRIGEPNARRGRNKIKYYRLTAQGIAALEELDAMNRELWQDFPAVAEREESV